MPDPVVVVTTVVAGVLGGIGLWASRRAAAKAGIGLTSSDTIRDLQILADTRLALIAIEHEARVKAEGALAEILSGRTVERELAAQCRSDLDDARSRIRTLERRRAPKADA